MSTALAFSEEKLISQSVDLPSASRGATDVVVKLKGTASACHSRARMLASSQASRAVIAAGLPVLPAAQLGLGWGVAPAGRSSPTAMRQKVAAERTQRFMCVSVDPALFTK